MGKETYSWAPQNYNVTFTSSFKTKLNNTRSNVTIKILRYDIHIRSRQ